MKHNVLMCHQCLYELLMWTALLWGIACGKAPSRAEVTGRACRSVHKSYVLSRHKATTLVWKAEYRLLSTYWPHIPPARVSINLIEDVQKWMSSNTGTRRCFPSDLFMLVIVCVLFVGTEPSLPQTMASMEYLQITQPNGILNKSFASLFFLLKLFFGSFSSVCLFVCGLVWCRVALTQ